MTTETMRAQFEAWAVGEELEVTRDGTLDQYSSFAVQSRWEVWQAALHSPAVAGLVEAAGKVEQRLIPLLSGKLRDVDHADFVAFFAALANFTGDKL